MFNDISDNLGIEHDIIPFDENGTIVENDNALKNAEDDFDFARQTIRQTIEKMNGLFDDAIYIAKESEQIKAFDTVKDLGSTVAAMSDMLVKLHTATLKQAKQPTTVNNNLIVHNTNDIIRMLREKKEAEKKET